MSTTNHITHRLQDYLDGTLAPEVRQDVDRHLVRCNHCRAEYEALRDLLAGIESLPREIEPAHDLWEGVRDRIAPADTEAQTSASPPDRAGDRVPAPSPVSSDRRAPSWRRHWMKGVVALLLIGIGTAWMARRFSQPAWEVVSLTGRPWIGGASVDAVGKLRVGEWLETDAASRARLDVGTIGQVEVAPDTRLQLREALNTDHRLVLEEGRIEAFIWAPPRLFFVETPSALAIDLGCIYTLTVDSTGTSLLHVTVGYVELEHPGRTSLVRAGAMCLARPGMGPGTPFDENASETLRQALARYDFEDGGPDALTEVLAEARAADAITLWHLFLKTAEPVRARVYDRLAELVPPPAATTRESALRHEPADLDAWARRLGLNLAPWTAANKKSKTAIITE